MSEQQPGQIGLAEYHFAGLMIAAAGIIAKTSEVRGRGWVIHTPASPGFNDTDQYNIKMHSANVLFLSAQEKKRIGKFYRTLKDVDGTVASAVHQAGIHEGFDLEDTKKF